VTGLAEWKRSSRPTFRRNVGKRVIDISLSLALIIILAPLLLLLCFLVRATSAGPALFRQERLGQHMRPFTMLKLRTMCADNDDSIHREYIIRMLSVGQHGVGRDGLFKLDCDPRVTPLGGWLRRSSLDELPQLFNVLRGDMSIVGPRPVLPWEAQLFDVEYLHRFQVKPGITGLWQVSGRNRLSMQQALELDVEYALRYSVVLDLTIILRPVPAVLRGGAR
jgi:lipopolysaccharide/colanic/teichoic acid biosynthesis glycosyltransferase